uniref:Uncharacterized protein n=1 Tax=Rhizophora mucronata TaxID=61149 RepID=A0A2P2NJQ7_RHIMU
MLPVKEFFARISATRELLKHCGISPVKLLLDKSRMVRETNSQNNCGISPAR